MSCTAPWSARCRRTAVLAALFVLVRAGAVAGEEDPWRLLADLRDRLAAGPRLADFVQTYVPAGFGSGESESGTVAFALPERVRWDYSDPFPRSFLVVGATVYSWSEGDDAGRRLDLEAPEARHLDLLRLDTAQLAGRYAAERIAPPGGDGVEVLLRPLDPASEIVEARIALDRDLALASLSYRDAEGNATRFDFSSTRPLENAGHLLPPDLEWQEP